MTSLKDTNFKTAAAAKGPIGWPQQLTPPEELMQSLKQRSQLCLMRSPLCSKLVLQVVGSWAYLLAHVLNKSRVHNIEVFRQELQRIETNNSNSRAKIHNEPQKQQQKAPLLTLSNHISCIDDPVLWASLLPLSYYSTNTDSVRWSPAAFEICFSKAWHSTFFSLGKTFPIIRGAGLYQPAMDFASAILRYNQWLHLFPEGRVMRDDEHNVISNKERGYLFKWGISKLILDYFLRITTTSDSDPKIWDKTIRILPFYHMGLDEILPIGWPYIPKFGKKITIVMRSSVIEMNSSLLNRILNDESKCTHKIIGNDDEAKRIKLTRYLESEIEELVQPTNMLHQQ